MVVTVWKDDMGTEVKAIKATYRVEEHAKLNFEDMIENWWYSVMVLAKQLCREMGAYDTGTLHDSIRILYQAPAGGFFEVFIAITPSRRDITIDRGIVAGGGMFINPKTGRIVDYALIVHDGGPTSRGTGYISGRPFMTLAVDMMMPEFDAIMNQFMEGQGRAWERD